MIELDGVSAFRNAEISINKFSCLVILGQLVEPCSFGDARQGPVLSGPLLEVFKPCLFPNYLFVLYVIFKLCYIPCDGLVV